MEECIIKNINQKFTCFICKSKLVSIENIKPENTLNVFNTIIDAEEVGWGFLQASNRKIYAFCPKCINLK